MGNRKLGEGVIEGFHLSSKGTAVWPEEDLEDLVCDVTCAVVHRYWECVI
jgi:hypothetical protein